MLFCEVYSASRCTLILFSQVICSSQVLASDVVHLRPCCFVICLYPAFNRFKLSCQLLVGVSGFPIAYVSNYHLSVIYPSFSTSMNLVTFSEVVSPRKSSVCDGAEGKCSHAVCLRSALIVQTND